MGLTVSDAVRILDEGALPLELFSGSETHDTWFRAKVLEVLNDIPDIPNDEVEAHFKKRRQTARNKEAGIMS